MAAAEGRNLLEGLEGQGAGTVTIPAPVEEDVRSNGRVPGSRETPRDLVSLKVLEEHAMEHQAVVKIVAKPFRVRLNKKRKLKILK